ncbi:MAG: cell division protein FtsA, partial [Oscillospiraceae bacterium]
TSDIAVCREGSVVGYTMATVAGDEITETLMRTFLVDFQTAERMKPAMSGQEPMTFTDILGLQQTATPRELQQAVEETTRQLAREIADRILAVNADEVPAALFLAGGGSQLVGLCDVMADCLGIDSRRVAVAGSNFEKTAFSDDCDINNPEYATPLGIAVSAGLGLIHDSYIVLLNDRPAKLFRNGTLTVQDILLMNGYTYADMLGRTGQSLAVTLDGNRRVLYGEPATPCILLLNGDAVSGSTVVHAGDAITFVPARHGRSGALTLAGLLGEDFCGTALVNGMDCPADEILKQGDVVTTACPPPEREEPIAPPPPRRLPIHLTLNGEPRELEGKEDGTPYYLMD